MLGTWHSPGTLTQGHSPDCNAFKKSVPRKCDKLILPWHAGNRLDKMPVKLAGERGMPSRAGSPLRLVMQGICPAASPDTRKTKFAQVHAGDQQFFGTDQVQKP